MFTFLPANVLAGGFKVLCCAHNTVWLQGVVRLLKPPHHLAAPLSFPLLYGLWHLRFCCICIRVDVAFISPPLSTSANAKPRPIRVPHPLLIPTVESGGVTKMPSDSSDSGFRIPESRQLSTARLTHTRQLSALSLLHCSFDFILVAPFFGAFRVDVLLPRFQYIHTHIYTIYKLVHPYIPFCWATVCFCQPIWAACNYEFGTIVRCALGWLHGGFDLSKELPGMIRGFISKGLVHLVSSYPTDMPHSITLNKWTIGRIEWHIVLSDDTITDWWTLITWIASLWQVALGTLITAI